MTGPLLPFDDYPIHQAPEPLRRVGSTHPRWTERWYFNFQDPSGALLGIAGGGFYPMTGIVEGYACLLVDGRQHSVRAQTRASDRLDMGSGSGIDFVVDEPLSRWGIDLNLGSVHGRLSFDSTKPPFLFEQFNVPADRWGEGADDEFDAIQHFVQPGQIAGVLELDGHQIDTSGHRSFRDRTWGVRSNRPKLHNWYVVHLDNGSYLTMIHQERADGTRMASEMALVAADGTWSRAVVDDHDLRFDPISRLLLEGSITAHTTNGELVVVEVTNIGDGIRLLGAGYTPAQGTGRDDGGSQGEVWDLTDPDTVRRVGRGTIDSPVRAVLRWGSQPDVVGMGVSESAIGKSHYRYGAGLE